MQIVQELCKRPGLNKTGFDMPTVYIPNPNKVSHGVCLFKSLLKYCVILIIIKSACLVILGPNVIKRKLTDQNALYVLICTGTRGCCMPFKDLHVSLLLISLSQH